MSHKFCSENDYANIDAVRSEYPGAASIIEVDGGWAVFDTVEDEQIWQNQV